MQRLPTPMLAAILAAPLLAAPVDAPLAEDAAASASSAERPGRYTMVPAEGGFVRLDTETGSVSHCRRDGEPAQPTWHCSLIPEAAIGDAGRADALLRRVDGLAAATAELTRRVTALERQEAAAQAPALARLGAATAEALLRLRMLVAEWKDTRATVAEPAAGAVKP